MYELKQRIVVYKQSRQVVHDLYKDGKIVSSAIGYELAQKIIKNNS